MNGPAADRARESVLTSLVDAAHELVDASAQGTEAVLRTVARLARRVIGADLAYVGLRDADDGALTVVASEGDATALNVGLRIAGPAGLGQAALGKDAPFSTDDYLADGTIDHADGIDRVVRAEGIRAVAAVPLRGPDGVTGALYGAHRRVHRFTAQEIDALRTLARTAASALATARRLESVDDRRAAAERDGARMRRALDERRRLEVAYDRLVCLVRDGAALDVVVETAATALGGALGVRDVGGGLLAAHGQLPAGDGTAAFARRCVEALAAGEPAPLDGGAWLVPVSGGGEVLGSLLFAPEEPLPDEVDGRALRMVAGVVALALLLERGAALAEGRIRDDLFDALLDPGTTPPARRQSVKRARRMGVDTAAPYVLVIARPQGGATQRAAVWATSYARRRHGLTSVRDGDVVLLLPDAGAESDSAAASAGRSVRDELSSVLGVPVTVGAAGPHVGLAEVARSYEDGRRCLRALVELGRTGSVAAPRDLGFLGVLLADAFSAPAYVDAVLGPVLRHDARRGTEFVRTLEAYFAAGASPRHAATTLHVHPNTVARRLERITELLGPDWQHPERALEVQLALRLHRTQEALLDGGARPGQAEGRSD
ncbi:helix-turn-helix domain-containing protein [Streptomyces sp. NPDC048057]|uniref:helix-turn-helix domain-containing protein n=1 Tax=Streptomyces sp. NPDC048057 TaxID=3155628 RepID=UPI0033F37912